MSAFPAVDPLPLPAPVELFKKLHDVTIVSAFYCRSNVDRRLLVATVLGLLFKERIKHCKS
jgi:hypothetical protein